MDPEQTIGQIDKRPLSVLILIVANCLFGIIGVITFLRFFSPYRPQEIEISVFPETFNLVWAVAFLIGGGVHILVMYGLLRAKRWSRSAQKIVAIPCFLVFPHGTIYALIAFLGLNRSDVDIYFSR